MDCHYTNESCFVNTDLDLGECVSENDVARCCEYIVPLTLFAERVGFSFADTRNATDVCVAVIFANRHISRD